MIQALVATLMWALVASLLIFRRKRADRSITYASFTIAVAMTLNVDAIYLATDPLLGGMNVTTLVSDGLLMTGIFFLGRGVMRADEYRPRLVRVAVGIPVLVASLLAITTTFVFIDRGTTTTRFMIDLGAQPAAAARGGRADEAPVRRRRGGRLCGHDGRQQLDQPEPGN